MRKPRQLRRGAALVLAMVCLLVVATISVALTRLLVDEHRQAQRRQHQVQALWVAESAVQRAAVQLRASSDYGGETWRIDAATMGGKWPAEAVIRIEPVESHETLRRVVVHVHYPKREVYGALQERQILIELPTSGESP